MKFLQDITLGQYLPNLAGAIEVRKDGETVWTDTTDEYQGVGHFPAEHRARPTAGVVELDGALDGEGEASADVLRLAAINARRAALPMRPPLLVKIAPDLADDALGPIVEACVAQGIAGLIISNTTITRPASLQSALKDQAGGLSGAPLFGPSTALLRRGYRLAQGRIALIGVGGIASAEQAYTKIRAGASLVQLYSGFAYAGPALVRQILDGLAALLARDGFTSVADAVGKDA
jgi:dihydroorotate dehydrogenase